MNISYEHTVNDESDMPTSKRVPAHDFFCLLHCLALKQSVCPTHSISLFTASSGRPINAVLPVTSLFLTSCKQYKQTAPRQTRSTISPCTHTLCITL